MPSAPPPLTFSILHPAVIVGAGSIIHDRSHGDAGAIILIPAPFLIIMPISGLIVKGLRAAPAGRGRRRVTYAR